MTFDLQLIYEHLLIYAGALALLFGFVHSPMEAVGKPFIHTLIDSFPALKAREAIIKPFAVRTTALIIAYAWAFTLHEAYNAPAVVLGLYIHPAIGVLPSAFISVFFGREIHDWVKRGQDANKTSAV